MDPLSVIASSLTVLGAVRAAISTIGSIRNANLSLKIVIEELTNFETVMRHATETLCTYRGSLSRHQWAAVAALLEHAKSLIHELQNVIDELVRKKLNGIHRLHSKIGWVMNAQDIEGLKKRLGYMNANFSVLMNAITM